MQLSFPEILTGTMVYKQSANTAEHIAHEINSPHQLSF